MGVPLLNPGDQHSVPTATTGCRQGSADAPEALQEALQQGSNNADGGGAIIARQSNGNVGPGAGSSSVSGAVPSTSPLTAAAGTGSGGQAFENGAMIHSLEQSAILPSNQQHLAPTASAQLQPLQVGQQPPDLGASANGRVQASMQASVSLVPSEKQAGIDPRQSMPPQGQIAVQQANGCLQPQSQEQPQPQHQAATQEHLHASPDGSSHKRPRRAAASKRRTSADMLYEDMGDGNGGWEGLEEGTVVLPGVHNPGGLLHTASAGGSDSEGTKSEGGLETEDEEDIDEQEETDKDSDGECGSAHKRRRIMPSRGRGRARGASSSRIAPASTGRGTAPGGGGGAAGDGGSGDGGAAAGGTSPRAPIAPGAQASRGRSGGGGGRGQKSKKFTGVYHQTCGRWRAQFCNGGMVHQLGMYDTEDQAAQAWDRVSWVYRTRPSDLNFENLIPEYDKEDLKATVREQMDERMAIYKPRGKNAKADAERERARTTAARSPEGPGPAQGLPPMSPRGRPTGRAGATRKVPNSFIPPAQLPQEGTDATTSPREASREGAGSPPSSAAQSYNEARGHGARQPSGTEQQQQQHHHQQHGVQGGGNAKQGSRVAAAAEQQPEGGPQQSKGRGKRGSQGGGAGNASAKLSLADLGDAAAYMMETEKNEDDRACEGEAHPGMQGDGGGQTTKKLRGQRTRGKRHTTSLKGLCQGEEGPDTAATAAAAAPSSPQQQQQQQQDKEGSKRARSAAADGAAGTVAAPTQELGLVGESNFGSSSGVGVGGPGGVSGGGFLQMPSTSRAQGMGADAAGAQLGATAPSGGVAGSLLLPGMHVPASTGPQDDHLMLGTFTGLGLPSPSMSMPGGMSTAPASQLFSPTGAASTTMGGTMWHTSTLPGFAVGPITPSSAATAAPTAPHHHAFSVGPSPPISQPMPTPQPFAAAYPHNYMLPWHLVQGMCPPSSTTMVPQSTTMMPPSTAMMMLPVGLQQATLASPSSSTAAPAHGPPPLSPQPTQQQPIQQLQLTAQQQAQQQQLHLAVQQQQQQQELQHALQQQQQQQQQHMLWYTQQQQQQLRQHQAIWAQRAQQQQQQQQQLSMRLPRSYHFAAASGPYPNVHKLQPEDGGQWVGVLEGDQHSLLILARHQDEDEAARLMACHPPAAPLLNSFLAAPSSLPLPSAAPSATHHQQQQQASSQQAAPPNSATPTIAGTAARPLAPPAHEAKPHPHPQAAADQQQQQQQQQLPPGTPLPSSLLAPGAFPLDAGMHNPFASPGNEDHLSRLIGLLGVPTPTRQPASQDATPSPSSSGQLQQQQPQAARTGNPVAPVVKTEGDLTAGAAAGTAVSVGGIGSGAGCGGHMDDQSLSAAVQRTQQPQIQQLQLTPQQQAQQHQLHLALLQQQQQQQQQQELQRAQQLLQTRQQQQLGGAGSLRANLQSKEGEQQQQQQQQQQRQQQQSSSSAAATRFLNRPAPPPLDLGAIMGANQAIFIHHHHQQLQQQQQQQASTLVPSSSLQQRAHSQGSPPAPHSAVGSAPGTPPALQQQQLQLQQQQQQLQQEQQQQQERIKQEYIVHAALAPAPTSDAATAAAAAAAAATPGALPLLSSRTSKDSCSMAFVPLHGTPREGHAGVGHSAQQRQGSGEASLNGTLSDGMKLHGSGQGCSPQHTPGHSVHRQEHDSPGPTSSHSLISTPAPSLPSPHSKATQHASTHAPRPSEQQQQQQQQ